MKKIFTHSSSSILFTLPAILAACASGADEASTAVEVSPNTKAEITTASAPAQGEFREFVAEDALPPEALTDEPGRDVTKEQFLAFPFTYGPFYGGTGGSYVGWQGGGGILYAIRIIVNGTTVAGLQFASYTPSQSDDQYRSGDGLFTSGWIGSNSGTYDSGWYYCPGGYAGVGLMGRSGTLVDNLDLQCIQITNPANRWGTPFFGGSGGGAFAGDCPVGGRRLCGIDRRQGSQLDAIRLVCCREF